MVKTRSETRMPQLSQKSSPDSRDCSRFSPAGGILPENGKMRSASSRAETAFSRLSCLLLTLVLLILAQMALEPPSRSVTSGTLLYGLAVAGILWCRSMGEWMLADHPAVKYRTETCSSRWGGLIICLGLCFLAFVSFGGALFTRGNLFIWILAFIAFLYTFWSLDARSLRQRIRSSETRRLTLLRSFLGSRWTLWFLLVFGISAFYRFYLLDHVPAEMFSDHAEKLLDVRDLLAGETRIFFPRNTGREGFQMYLTAAVILLFDSGLSFASLKLGTVLCGLFTLPFIYLLGKEIANRQVGLWAMLFAGVAYWPNVISRVALRFTLYPAFTAPALYFLIRGLRRQNRNDFILAGVFLGIGLHGYTAYRFVPVVVVVAVILYSMHKESRGSRKSTMEGLLMTALASLIIFLPLLRYLTLDPTGYSYRMLTRIGQLERPYPGNPFLIFLENFWDAATMVVWSNGQIWVHSIPYRPALGVVAGALFVAGVVLLSARYFSERNWLDLFLLVSFPLLLMPSILSLTFPQENPSLNRTGGALVVVFLIVGLAFDGLLNSLKSCSLQPAGRWLAWGVASCLLAFSAFQNYNLVFNQYAEQYRSREWNTSELGTVIRGFVDSNGAEDRAWVVPFPHWVDTRLVGITAGYPRRDFALQREDLMKTLHKSGAKLFLFKPEDMETLRRLQELYPSGDLQQFESVSEGRDFCVYTVPAAV